jgi:hypothetical protein
MWLVQDPAWGFALPKVNGLLQVVDAAGRMDHVAQGTLVGAA